MTDLENIVLRIATKGGKKPSDIVAELLRKREKEIRRSIRKLIEAGTLVPDSQWILEVRSTDEVST